MAAKSGKGSKGDRRSKDKQSLLHPIDTEIEILERHVLVLDTIIKEKPIGIIRISKRTGLADHLVRYSLRMLEQQNLIEPSPEGAVPTRSMEKELPKLKKALAAKAEQLKKLSKHL